MKKNLIIMALFTILFISFGNAQERKGRRGNGPEKAVEALDEKADLTDSEKTELTAIFTDFQEKMKEDRENRRGYTKERDEAVAKVLSPEKNAIYQEMLKEQKARMRSRVKNRQ
ncbi:hypothetical protein [Galbibacter mesophilus]|uniref:hypothetical protein n=1 Tax=Galbibacter mesophilus TaxID=379069 RepID=UPI00191CBAAB|nr:hypothetical protein [Galbibacter mesophilus]MCM5663007.1 hypothetical protein [Galbibacter mesophilus]